MKLYYLRVSFAVTERVFGIMFTHPPMRKHVEPLFRAEWNKLKEHEQNRCWEWMLILDFIPNICWFGKIETIYGTVEIIEKDCIENPPDEQEISQTDQRTQARDS